MKKENTASRLKEIMENRNLRQVDILNMTRPYCQEYNVKMNKSDISQYCSGKTEPNQDKLFVLGMALNVSESWLMGFDVPMERSTPEGFKRWAEHFNNTHKQFMLNQEEQKVITNMRNGNLTEKDERDIEKILNSTREHLLTQEGLMFDGDPATPEAIDSILSAMQIGMEMAKKKNKEKYTPKKYRKA